jgi:hypothetical protein
MTIKNESLEEMLNIMSKIVPISYTVDEKHVKINGIQ